MPRSPKPRALLAQAIEVSTLTCMAIWRSSRGTIWACPVENISSPLPCHSPQWPLAEKRRHFQGGICIVLHRHCRLVDRQEPYVLYRTEDGRLWLQSRHEFDGDASPGVARFAFLH